MVQSPCGSPPRTPVSCGRWSAIASSWSTSVAPSSCGSRRCCARLASRGQPRVVGAARGWPGWQPPRTLGSEARWVLENHLADLRRLDEAIVRVEARVAQVTAGDPVVAQLVALRGVGPVTAWALRAVVGRFDRFHSGKQLARYCGLSPRNASSGQRQADAGLIKAGSELLRATLIEAAHRLIRFDTRWGALAARLRAAGKPACVVAAAVANRWVRWLFHQVEGGPITLRSAS